MSIRHLGLALLLAGLLAGCGGGGDLDLSKLPVPWVGADYAVRHFAPDSTRVRRLGRQPITGVTLLPRGDIMDIKVNPRPLNYPDWSGPGAGNPIHVDVALLTLQTGRRFEGMGEWGAAGGTYKLAVEQNPLLIPAWERYGNALVRLGDLDRALAAFRSAVAVDPRYAMGQVNIGQIHERRGELDLAESAYGRALDADPWYPAFYTVLARLLVTRGRFDEALDVLRRSADLLPDNPDILAAEASIHRRIGNAVAADSLDRRAERLRSPEGPAR